MQLEAYRSVDIWEAASRPGQLKVINTKIRQLKHLPISVAVLQKVLRTDRDLIRAYFESQRHSAKHQYTQTVELNDLQVLAHCICMHSHAKKKDGIDWPCLESEYGQAVRMINEPPKPLCTGNERCPFIWD